MLDFTNRCTYWTAVDCANQFGLDKKSFEDRIKWVSENYNDLENLADEAESKWEYLKSVKALWSIQAGLVPEHMVYLDASNQALQLYAVLTGDLKTASTCNLANNALMADAYQLLANALNKQMGLKCFTRTNCKKALMTTMYGKLNGWDKIIETMYPKSSEPLYDFAAQYNLDIKVDDDTGFVEIEELSKAFSNALLDIAPKAIAAMEAIQELNDKNIGVYHWKLPDGFNVKYDVKSEINIECEATTKSGIVLEMSVTKEIYTPSEFNRGMSPNVIHSVDGWVAREMVRRMNGKFITTIHDAFACHPSDADLMRQNYQDIMVELLHSDMLNNILSQIAHTDIYISKDNGLTEEHIRNSVYFLG